MQSFYKPLLFLLAMVVVVGCDSGTVPADLGTSTSVTFTDNGAIVDEDAGTVEFEIRVTDPGFKPFSVQLAQVQNEFSGDEIDAPASMAIQFPESTTSGETRTFEIEIEDDNLFNEGDETIVYELTDNNNTALGDTTTFVLQVRENDVVADALPIAEARDRALGDSVAVRGVVTRKEGDNVFIQDDSGTDGATGIVVRDTGDDGLADQFDDGDVQPGDLIQVSGDLGAFSGLIQVSSNVTFVQVERNTQGLPTPTTITVADVIDGGGEDYEGEYVTIAGVTIDPDGDETFGENANYDITDSSTSETTTMRITDDSFYNGEPIPTGTVTVTGVLSQFNFGFGGARGPDFGYQLIPLVDGEIE